MNAGPLAPLIADFAQNWAAQQPDLAVSVVGAEVDVDEGHPLFGELTSLCNGSSASLPFFAKANEVLWCTIAPDNDALRQSVAALHAWVLPSFAGAGTEDGYVQPQVAKGGLAAKIIASSPDGYYRWRCPRAKLPQIIEKLRLQRSLEAIRPPRTRPPRPSLYELRARFAAALLIGDRDGAEEIISQLDSLQLETAVNTQFMRIRMWHHFRELDRIRDHPALPHLLAQPLPPRVRSWIDEALGVQAAPAIVPPPEPPPAAAKAEVTQIAPVPLTWADWFAFVKVGKKVAADLFLQERQASASSDFSSSVIETLVGGLEEFFVEEALRNRERGAILEGVSEIIEQYVREPEFPRPALGKFYLVLLQLWGALHAGTSIGREHGHVLLELASALLRLNLEPKEVRKSLEDWWRAKAAPSQLPFALDAIELLERELPGTDATGNLWVEAADVIKRSTEALPTSDRELWRSAGNRLGIDADAVAEYLPPEAAPGEGVDTFVAAQLHHVAIICLREEQANQAANVIRERSGAKVTIVTATAAGAETTQACQADVVLFVWMASTHAVFRAFDRFDRKRFCYVQGTGSSSIVRTLERWVTAR
jgi:hypothetical protein